MNARHVRSGGQFMEGTAELIIDGGTYVHNVNSRRAGQSRQWMLGMKTPG
jgi:hypothetical protein